MGRHRIFSLFSLYRRPSQSVSASSKTRATKKSICNQTEVSLGIVKHLLGRSRAQNCVISPLSLHVLLGIIAAGSSYPSLNQLLRFLQFKYTTDNLTSFNSQLVAAILSDASPAGGPRLSVAHGIWTDQSIPLLPRFKQVVSEDYKATLASVDFYNNAPEAVKKVNLWAEKETNGLVKDLLSPWSVDRSTYLLFANALYFKGSWNEPFDVSDTKLYDFYLLNGTSVKVPFMTSKKKHFIKVCNGFNVLRLPYKRGNDIRKFSLYVFLPDRKNGLGDLIEQLTSKAFLESNLPHEEVEVGHFRLPRFNISYQFNARDAFIAMGLDAPFNFGLTKIVDPSACKMAHPRVSKIINVSDIIQKSFIRVNEEGTEATFAGVSCFGTSMRFPTRINFVADHPFVFLIREDLSGTLLFIGQVVYPEGC